MLVGHSWGGSLCLAYPANYPEGYAGSVLLAPYAFDSSAKQSLLEYFLGTTIPTLPIVGDVAIRLLAPLLGERLIEQGLKTAFHPDPVPEEYLKRAINEWTRPEQVWAYAEDEKTIDQSLAELEPHFPWINKPMVIIAGEEDTLLPACEQAIRLGAMVPEARLMLVSGAGYQLQNSHPEEVLSAVRSVLKDDRNSGMTSETSR